MIKQLVLQKRGGKKVKASWGFPLCFVFQLGPKDEAKLQGASQKGPLSSRKIKLGGKREKMARPFLQVLEPKEGRGVFPVLGKRIKSS